MAKMIPQFISDDTESYGEREIYNLFSRAPETKDWYVLHSYALRRSKQGEIDFLVLTPDLGIFCLEVKSDRLVGPINGTNKCIYLRRGKRVEDKDPFKQASNGMYKLIKAFSSNKETSMFDELLIFYGVMLPNSDFIINSIEHPKELVFYNEDFKLGEKSIVPYIQRLSQYALKYYPEKKFINDKTTLLKLVNYLRPQFEEPLTLSLWKEIESKQARYTQEQINVLDALEDNDRLMVLGGAGTGKTMMALEIARRALFKGEKVFFTCYNRNLVSMLENIIKNDASIKNTINNLKLNNFHRFLNNDICGNLDKKHTITSNTDNSKYFDTDLPKMALDVLSQSKSFDLFDRLVIDEGQDLINNNLYLDVFDAILKGGLMEGKWFICCDERQAIFDKSYKRGHIVKNLHDRLYPSNFTTYHLSRNCRNTKQIAEKTASECKFKLDDIWKEIFVTEGQDVEKISFADDEDQIAKIQEIIERLVSNQIPLRNISILSPITLEKSETIKFLISNSTYKISTRFEDFFDKKDVVTLFTIHSFKGLENSYIILVDINKSFIDELLLYVAMTRARVKLYILNKKRQ